MFGLGYLVRIPTFDHTHKEGRHFGEIENITSPIRIALDITELSDQTAFYETSLDISEGVFRRGEDVFLSFGIDQVLSTHVVARQLDLEVHVVVALLAVIPYDQGVESAFVRVLT